MVWDTGYVEAMEVGGREFELRPGHCQNSEFIWNVVLVGKQ